MKWFSPAEASALKDCAKSTITRAMKRGDLSPKRGKVSEADLANWEPLVRRPKRAAIEPVAPATPTTKPAGADGDDGPKLTELQRANQRMKLIELERAERAWQREQGLVFEKAEVVKMLADFGHRIRSEMQSHPRKMQADMVRHIRCKSCGGSIEGKIIAIAAERYVADLLRVLADDPLGAKGA